MISDAAGCIGTLMSLYQIMSSPRILDTAIQCGDRILAGAKRMERGKGWINPYMGKTRFRGFSHGASGIAWALLELSAVTGH